MGEGEEGMAMTDRELLELAAKAAEVIIGEWSDECEAFWCGNAGTIIWNPLNDDGDALRLAVKLQLRLRTPIVNSASVWDRNGESLGWVLVDNGDPYAATRRAIVRAAAEIGVLK